MNLPRPLLPAALGAALLSVAGCGKPEKKFDRPNVLLITLDTVRADHLSCYGYSRETTPNLDRLAAESVRFANAYSQSSFTPPSHASIMTARLPTSHGLLYWNKKLPEEVVTIAELLQGTGYDTASFSPLKMGTGNGLDQGFKTVVEIGEHITQVDPDTTYNLAPAPVILGEFWKWFGQPRTAPFFSWIHLYDAHRPYSVFAPDREFCKVKDGRLGNQQADYQMDQATRKQRGLGEPQAQYLINRYDSGLLGLDREVGKLLDRLRGEGVLDHTILIVTADHGEAFDEFDEVWFTHDHYLFDAVTHVPLFIRFPDGSFAGSAVEPLAQLVDVVPTLLDYLGRPKERFMQGTSLRPLIEQGKPIHESVAAERQARDIGADKQPLPPDQFDFDRTLRTPKARLVYQRRLDRYRLFDRSTQQPEQNDTFDAQAPASQAMLRTFAQFFKRIEAVRPNLVTKDLTPEDEARLKELGY